MRKLLVLALGLGLVSLPGIFTAPAKAQSIEPPHTRNAGSPYQTLKRKKQVTPAVKVKKVKRQKAAR